MNVLFRVDSSDKIGSGHLMRCLSLADELQKNNSRVNFVCRKHPKNLISLISEKGYSVNTLPTPAPYDLSESQTTPQYDNWLGVSWRQDADETIQAVTRNGNYNLLVVDHYSLDHKWHSLMRPYIEEIMVIDDLANRDLDCDILLDQTFGRSADAYKHLIPEYCRALVGAQYILLRPEFIEARETIRNKSGSINNLLIFFGGIDATNETAKAIEAVRLLKTLDFSVIIVVGENNPHRRQIEQICHELSPRFRYLCQVENMAELMADSDLAIGAGGTSALERCVMGLPSLIISIADNQKLICNNLAKSDLALYLGDKDKVTPPNIADRLSALAHNPNMLKKLSGNALRLFDPNGTQRVVEAILKI